MPSPTHEPQPPAYDPAPERAEGTPVLSVEGLTRRFGALVVLDAVDLTVAAGQVVALLGPNGAGKSTLLRCVVGADAADAGRILLQGEPFDEADARMRGMVASVLDDIDFFPDLSVVEHLHLLALAHGGGGDPVDEVVTDLGLDRARDQLPATLSSGQRRRLALASCFVRPRRLLVLDEPEQRLDTAGRAWLAGRLRRERDEGGAVLMASHDPELVDAVADSRVRLGP